MKKYVLLLLLLALPTEVQAAVMKYYVPNTQFNAALQVMDRGMANIIGLFQSATGAFAFDRETETISQLRIAIDASSLMVPNRGVSDDLSDLFDPQEFVELTFMATAPHSFKDGKATIKGTLNIHGQKKEAMFEATLNNTKSKTIGLSLRGSFKRSDFNMGDEPEMPGRFGESITLMLEMEATGT